MPSRDRPVVCPCCGAPLRMERHDRLKYRLFSYECGASGWCCEEYRLDPETLSMVLQYASSPEWAHACPHAMSALEEWNALRGEKCFNPRNEAGEPFDLTERGPKLR
jgi:hypothetical protein